MPGITSGIWQPRGDQLMFETTAAVILAAGQGTRMRSRTPKVLHEILGRPLVNFPVKLAQALGVERIVVVVGHGSDAVRAAVLEAAPNAQFAVQVEQRGTADAVKAAAEATVGCDSVLILSGDVPGLSAATVRALAEARQHHKTRLVAAGFRPADMTGYGRLVTAGGKLQRIVEDRDATGSDKACRDANAGIYFVDRDFLFDAIGRVSTDNDQGEFYLTDIAAIAAEAGQPGAVVICDDHFEVSGINNRAQLSDIAERFRKDTNRDHMLNGVTMWDPANTTIELEVTLGRDVTVHGGVQLLGSTTVAEAATVMAGSVIRNATIGEGVLVKPYCVIEDSVMKTGSMCGPFAHLRPGTVLCESSKVGNFVETKKTTLGVGSKASHLSYIGDATVGRNVNIGAGTITCNYDGVSKHHTHIEDRVFIGSNSELVAPLTLGEECLIGAGTTVTTNVPAGALAISRAKQVDIEGWSKKHGPHARKRRADKKKSESNDTP
ncbi:MAG: bifunctional UDP-N-acetylglucosamine pyrophosphorylase/glucosamine-1-phosphate N-acetyltransferase [Myxococcota bacterium]|jgi:bifunctional UDP-N-acetylglucosamine pyrophosphorylase/glucosamine-1-phosphate N-acetyltransferase